MSVTITANIKSTEFLDVWLDLNSGSYRPYMKSNSKPLYIHTDSNHPKTIKNQIPEMVNVQTNIEGRSIACPSDKEGFLTKPQHNDAPGISLIYEILQVVVGNNNKSVEYRADVEGYFTDDEL